MEDYVVESILNKAESRYNPEKDLIPGAPVVTSTDMDLVQVTKILYAHIQSLYLRIEFLEYKINQAKGANNEQI